MPYADSELLRIVNAVAAQLRTDLSLAASDAFIGEEDDDEYECWGDHYAVGCSGGSFAAPYIDGGGAVQATCTAELWVKIVSTLRVDDPGRETQLATQATLGLLSRLSLVLDSIAGLEAAYSGNTITREPIQPVSTDAIRRLRADRAILVTRFAATFDWSLS